MRRKKNPCDHNGVQLRWLVCESIYHFAQISPETKSQDTFFSQEIVPFETDYDYLAKLRTLVSESRNANTVTGASWMNTYIDSLEDEEKVKVRCRESENFCCFVDGNTVPAIKNVDIPMIIKE